METMEARRVKRNSRAERKERRAYLGGMAVALGFGVIQGIMLYNRVALANVVYLLVSIAAVGLYIYGIVDFNQRSSNKLYYTLIRRWLLAAYIVVLAILSRIF